MSNSIHTSANASNIARGAFRSPMLSRVLGAVKSWRNRSIAIRELHAMPDTLLHDIGIARWQIEDAVNHRTTGGAQLEIHRLHDNTVAVSAEHKSTEHKPVEHKQAA